jgi:hypothetical protein
MGYGEPLQTTTAQALLLWGLRALEAATREQGALRGGHPQPAAAPNMAGCMLPAHRGQLSGSTLSVPVRLQTPTFRRCRPHAKPLTAFSRCCCADSAAASLAPPQLRVCLLGGWPVGAKIHGQAHVCLWQQVSTFCEILQATPAPGNSVSLPASCDSYAHT